MLAGLIIWLIPAPVGVTAKAWHLLAVFVGTIVGIITNVSELEKKKPPTHEKKNARKIGWLNLTRAKKFTSIFFIVFW